MDTFSVKPKPSTAIGLTTAIAIVNDRFKYRYKIHVGLEVHHVKYWMRKEWINIFTQKGKLIKLTEEEVEIIEKFTYYHLFLGIIPEKIEFFKQQYLEHIPKTYL